MEFHKTLFSLFFNILVSALDQGQENRALWNSTNEAP